VSAITRRLREENEALRKRVAELEDVIGQIRKMITVEGMIAMITKAAAVEDDKGA
jgi:hypothetical protein